MTGIYFASKAKHGPRWRALRATGLDVTSTWIDESGEGQTADWEELWDRIYADIKRSHAMVFYGENGEVQKGALVEIGMARGAGLPVFWLGPEFCTVRRSSHVTVCDSLEEAIALAKRGWAGAIAKRQDARRATAEHTRTSKGMSS